MQSCVSSEKIDINKIMYMTQRLFPNGYKNLQGP